MVKELKQKLEEKLGYPLNFVGRSEKERKKTESEIKSGYSIEDFEFDDFVHQGRGYKIRDKKNEQDIYFSPNSRLTLETRYLEKDNLKNPSENVLDLFARVATNIAEADLKYDPNANISDIASEFLELLVHKKFMPNTPTICNAGRALQQLSACFVLPIEDYMATDDIGEDPEKQGMGIFDILKYVSMIHKSGGGTGFNWGHLRPRTDRVSTTFGSSSGPVSFLKIYDAATDGVNQGGFRRGANMGIMPYYHPDIIEFISEKAIKKGMSNFNLSIGLDEKFMKLVEEDGFFDLINPKDENRKSLEERLWKKESLLKKGTKEYSKLFSELGPSLIISEENDKVVETYENEVIGRISDKGNVQLSAKKLFEKISKYAWMEGCPGVIFLDRLEEGNKTPHIGKIEATNPCGEQPLLAFEACNLGAINLSICVKEKKSKSEISKPEINYKTLDDIIEKGVHFLDNVVDMSKFPFKKIYQKVHGNRKIGLGLMGWAEMISKLGISYGSEESIELAKNLSKYITDKAREISGKLAEKRGAFPFWEGSFWEKQGLKVRNATVTTIAPNGTTGMIADVNGGIEPYFRLAYKKTCMDGKELSYIIPELVKDLENIYPDKKELKKVLEKISQEGGIQGIKEVPQELKNKYKTSSDVVPEKHVEMQAAFQSGIDNAVSKTVNLPEKTSVEEVEKIYLLARKKGCVGITVFRDGSKKGVYSKLEKKVISDYSLVQNQVEQPPILEVKPDATKMKIKRKKTNDSLHIIVDSDLYVDGSNKKAYFVPVEIFQNRSPLGHATTTSFQQSGMDRTEILKSENPDYVRLIQRLQSPFSHEEEGMGPKKIKSIEHAVGIALEYYFLKNGIIGRDEHTNKLQNLVSKKNLRKIDEGSEEYKKIINSNNKIKKTNLVVNGNNIKLSERFLCEDCGSEEYTFEAGCNSPKCKSCGTISGGGCG